MPWTRWNRDTGWRQITFTSPIAARRAEVLEGIGDLHALEHVDAHGHRRGAYVGQAEPRAPAGRGAYVDEAGATAIGTFRGRALGRDALIWLPDHRWFRGERSRDLDLRSALTLKPSQLSSGVGRLGPGDADAGTVKEGKTTTPSVSADAFPFELWDYSANIMSAPHLTSDGLSLSRGDVKALQAIHDREMGEWESSRATGRPQPHLVRNERQQTVERAVGPNAALEELLVSVPGWPLETREGEVLAMPAALMDPVWGVPMLEPEHPLNAQAGVGGPVRDRAFRLLERGMMGASSDDAQPDERLQVLVHDFIGQHALDREESATSAAIASSLRTGPRRSWSVVDLHQSNLPWRSLLVASASREPSLGAVIGEGFAFRGDLSAQGALTLNVSESGGILARQSFAGEFRGGRPAGRGRVAFEDRVQTGAPWTVAFEAVGTLGAGAGDAFSLEGSSALSWRSGVELLGDFSGGRLASSSGVRVQWPNGGWYEGPMDPAWAEETRVTFAGEIIIPEAPRPTAELYARGRGLWRREGVELELSAPGMVGEKTWRQPCASSGAFAETLSYHGALSLAGEPEGAGRLEAYDRQTQHLRWSYRGEFVAGIPRQTESEAELTWHTGRRPITYRGTLAARAAFDARVLTDVWVFESGEGHLAAAGTTREGQLPAGALFTEPPTWAARPRAGGSDIAPAAAPGIKPPKELAAINPPKAELAAIDPPKVELAEVNSPKAELAEVDLGAAAAPSLPGELGRPSAVREPEAKQARSAGERRGLDPATPEPQGLSAAAGAHAQALLTLFREHVADGVTSDLGPWLDLVEALGDGMKRAQAFESASVPPEARRKHASHVLDIQAVLGAICARAPRLFGAAVALQTDPEIRELHATLRVLLSPEHPRPPQLATAFERLLLLQRDMTREAARPNAQPRLKDRGVEETRARALRFIPAAMRTRGLEASFETARARVEDTVPELRAARALVERARTLATHPPTPGPAATAAAASLVEATLEAETALLNADGWVHPRLEVRLDELRAALGDHQRSDGPRAALDFVRALEDQLEAARRSPHHLATTQVRRAGGINEGFWYEATHVEALIRDAARGADQRVLASAASSEQLRALLIDAKASLPSASSSSRAVLIAPFNPTQDHWRAVVIEVERRRGQWSVARAISLDPQLEPNAPFPEDLKEDIAAVLPGGRPKWLPSASIRQGDNVSCGPLVVESVRRVLEATNQGPLQAPRRSEPVDIRALRARHAETLVGLGFEAFPLTQRYNVPEQRV